MKKVSSHFKVVTQTKSIYRNTILSIAAIIMAGAIFYLLYGELRDGTQILSREVIIPAIIGVVMIAVAAWKLATRKSTVISVEGDVVTVAGGRNTYSFRPENVTDARLIMTAVEGRMSRPVLIFRVDADHSLSLPWDTYTNVSLMVDYLKAKGVKIEDKRYKEEDLQKARKLKEMLYGKDAVAAKEKETEEYVFEEETPFFDPLVTGEETLEEEK